VARALQKFPYALHSRTRPPLFCLILAEAFLLTKPHPTLSKGEGFKISLYAIINVDAYDGFGSSVDV